MITETLTITEALTQLKILGKRIDEAIEQGLFVKATSKKRKPAGFKTDEDCSKSIQSSYDSINGLMRRRMAIKRAVVKSNANTNVDVGGETMTVAEAIEYKNSIDFEKALLQRMVNNNDSEKREVDANNLRIDNEKQKIITQRAENEKTPTQEDIDFADEAMEPYKYTLLDPLNIKEKIEVLKNKIDNFFTKVDTVLATSNATTTITIEY